MPSPIIKDIPRPNLSNPGSRIALHNMIENRDAHIVKLTDNSRIDCHPFLKAKNQNITQSKRGEIIMLIETMGIMVVGS